jgi:hypothetical protein
MTVRTEFPKVRLVIAGAEPDLLTLRALYPAT